MDTSLDSLYPRPSVPAHTSQRQRSRGFLASVKGLVRQPGRPHLDIPTGNGRIPSSQLTSDPGYYARQRSQSSTPRIKVRAWGAPSGKKRRGREHVPSMIDYLTLAQLENVWHRQDSYRGCVSTPQNALGLSTEQPQRRSINRRPGASRDPHVADIHPALRATGPSLGGATWSRPPSYRP